MSNNKPHLVFEGDIFGRLTVLGFSHIDTRWRRHYKVRCECGSEKTVQGTLLRSGNTKSCGCLLKEVRLNSRISINHSDITAVILGYKRHALRRGYDWLLSREDAECLIARDCFYCGGKPSNTKITKNTIKPFKYNGIDRVDNTKGYSSSNVVPCCRVCNRAKETMTTAEFFDWAERLNAMANQWGNL